MSGTRNEEKKPISAPEAVTLKEIIEKAKTQQDAQIWLAKYYFSKGKTGDAEYWLFQAAWNSQGHKAICLLAQVIVDDKEDGLSLLNYIHAGTEFDSPSSTHEVVVNCENKTVIHCVKKSSTASENEDVSLRVIDPKDGTLLSPPGLLTYLRLCKQQRGPYGIAFKLNVILPTLPHKTTTIDIPLAIIYRRADFLFEEGKKLLKLKKQEEALKFFRQAAGHKEASPELITQVAEIMLIGKIEKLEEFKEIHLETDPEAALTLFQKAAEHKNASEKNKFRYACLLDAPTTFNHNRGKAEELILDLVKTNNHEACVYLAQRYFWDSVSLSKDKDGEREKRSSLLGKTRDLLKKAIGIDHESTQTENYHLLVNTLDQLGEHKEALGVLEQLDKQRNNAEAQLLLFHRLHCDAKGEHAKEYLYKAAKERATTRRTEDLNPAVLIAKAIQQDYEQVVRSDKFKHLIRYGNMENPLTGSLRDGSDRLTVEFPDCSLAEIKLDQDTVKVHLTECVYPDKLADSTTQPQGFALHVNAFDPNTRFFQKTTLALVTPLPPRAPESKEKPEVKPEAKPASPDSQRIVIMRSGHHTNNWLAVMADIDRIMPTLLKYLNRDWKRDISERGSGLEWLPQRLHLSLGKPAFGDVYVGKIGVGCACWIYVILSTPPPTLRPEIHTVFPVIVAKSRKYFARIKQILEWHNRIEATLITELERTTDPHCTPDVSMSPSPTLPLFAIDFVSRRNIWERRGTLEVFMSGIASWMVRNPQESLRILPRRQMKAAGWSNDPVVVPGGLNYADDEEEKKPIQPRSVVPDIQGAHEKIIPWGEYKDRRGVIINEGPRKENRVCYVQGVCQKTIELPGTIWGKAAFLVTIRIDEERKIDLDVWCLLKHMLDGRATIVPGEYMSIGAGSVPTPGDLVLADVWIHGTIATSLDPVPTAGTHIYAQKDIDKEGHDQPMPPVPAPAAVPAPAPAPLLPSPPAGGGPGPAASSTAAAALSTLVAAPVPAAAPRSPAHASAAAAPPSGPASASPSSARSSIFSSRAEKKTEEQNKPGHSRRP